MVRIAVVEDSEQDRRALLDCLHRYEKEQKLKFSIEEFQDGEDIVTGYSADYDLLLMDIEMTFMNGMKAAEKIRKLYADQGLRAVCYGMGDGLDEVRNASLAAKNVVVSPAALKAAQYLQKKFGTPYEIAYPLVSELVPEVNYQGKKILIVQQQVIANAVRKEIEKRTGEKEAITTATWFMRKEEILTDLNVDAVDDISLKEEDDFISLVEKEGYDVIFADPCMERMIPGFEGVFIPLTHFAVSGKLNV